MSARDRLIVAIDEPDVASARSLIERLGEVEHVFTHRKLRLVIHQVQLHSGDPAALGYPELRWVDQESVGGLPLSRLTKKVLAAVGWHDV